MYLSDLPSFFSFTALPDTNIRMRVMCVIGSYLLFQTLSNEIRVLLIPSLGVR